MMGQQNDNQKRLFYSFNLEDHVPPDHLLRGIAHYLDLRDLRQHLSSHYSNIGRPSIDPELMIRMLVIGYCFGIRSERRLCEEVHLNLAYRWFCRLGLEDAVPDHSTFSKNRHGRFRDSDVFRHFFDSVLRRCMEEGLVGGEGFAIDASIVKADANRTRGVPGTQAAQWSNETHQTRAVREYIEGIEAANPAAPQPKYVSTTDPGARYTAAPGGHAFFAYSTNYLIDLKTAVIVDVEATPAHRSDEVNSTKTMIDRVEERFDIKPDRLVGDMAYGSAEMLEWMVAEKQIEPHVPVWDKSERTDGTFGRSMFTFDAENKHYVCPAGKILRQSWRTKIKDPNRYGASKMDCQVCPLKPQCCPKTDARKIRRSEFEASRDVARAIAKTDAYLQSRRDRKKVEMLFAHLKRIMRLDRMRLRGLSGARDEFLLAATTQNLRRMGKRWTETAVRAQMVPI